MKLVFYWNYLNHHQVMVADELYRLVGNEFRFVTTMPLDENEMKGGSDFSDRPYCIRATESEEYHQLALQLAREADVCVFGACSQQYAVARAISVIQKAPTTQHLSFECGERWLKRGWINIFSPVLCDWWWNYVRYYRKAGFYKLCSSAFTASDDAKLYAYENRHYKWGYFTSVDDHHPSPATHRPSSITRLVWVARFLDWKHPELAVEVVKRLKDEGYSIHLDMYGDGPLRASQESWVASHVLTRDVTFHGNVPNDVILEAMGNSEILLMTSDCREGWGTVANEAMANGCCLLASDECGSVPYLVEDGKNGMMFKSKSADDLHKRLRYLLDNPEIRMKMAQQGYWDMLNIWSPRKAAENLLSLIDSLQNGSCNSMEKGPCSKA